MTTQTNPPDDGREIGKQTTFEQMNEICQCVDDAKAMSDNLRHSDEWQNYQLSKTQSVTPPPTVVKKCKKVTFINSFSEEKFRQLWPTIKEIVSRSLTAAFDWTCLQHVLTYYHKIEKVTFTVFMTWLNEFCGETLISPVNMRRQNDTVYFNLNIDVEWSSKNHQSHFSDHHLCYSLQEQSKYTRYYDLCNELWIAIRPYC